MTSIKVQRQSFFGNVDRLSHTSTEPILHVILSVFHHYILIGKAVVVSQVVTYWGTCAGAPSITWLAASRSHLHNAACDLVIWYTTPHCSSIKSLSFGQTMVTLMVLYGRM